MIDQNSHHVVRVDPNLFPKRQDLTVFNTTSVPEEFMQSLTYSKITPFFGTLPLGTGVENDLLAIDKHMFDTYSPDTQYATLYISSFSNTSLSLICGLDITAKPVLAYFTQILLSSLLSFQNPSSSLSLAFSPFPASQGSQTQASNIVKTLTLVIFGMGVVQILVTVVAGVINERVKSVKHL